MPTYRKGESILNFANTDCVQLRHVRREKKKPIMRDQWIIEMTEESFWTMEVPFKPYEIIPLKDGPNQVLYSISVSDRNSFGIIGNE
jgi:propanediol dehydratase large subunit